MAIKGDDAEAQIQRLREQVETLMTERGVPETEKEEMLQEVTREFQSLTTAEVEKIILRLDISIAEERKAMEALLSRLRSTLIAG